MLAKTFTMLVTLLLVIAAVGCEGDAGPAGPAGPAGQDGQDGQVGPPGPSVIIAFAEIDGQPNPPVVTSSWPSAVTVTVADINTGIWDVTLAGSFPSTQGIAYASCSDISADATLTAYITSWTTTQIVFRVGAWATLSDAFEDNEFTFVVLGE
jgi:hypothetical protein